MDGAVDVGALRRRSTTRDKVTAHSRAQTRTALGRERLALRTFQSPEAVEQLLRTGRLVGGGSLVVPEFAEAYSWMTGQMNARLSTQGSSAIWLWASIRQRDLKVSHAADDVELRCVIPRERVLLSSYQRWHFVLNRWVLPADPDSEEAWEAASDDEMKASWAGIFDVRHDISNRYAVQATVHYLDRSDIVSIRGTSAAK